MVSRGRKTSSDYVFLVGGPVLQSNGFGEIRWVESNTVIKWFGATRACFHLIKLVLLESKYFHQMCEISMSVPFHSTHNVSNPSFKSNAPKARWSIFTCTHPPPFFWSKLSGGSVA